MENSTYPAPPMSVALFLVTHTAWHIVLPIFTLSRYWKQYGDDAVEPPGPPPVPKPGTLYTAFGHTRPVEEAVVPLAERGFEKLYDDEAAKTDVRGELRRLNHSLILSVIETLDAATKRSSQHGQKVRKTST